MRPDLLGGALCALPASPRFAAGVWKRRGTESSRRGRREHDDGRHDLGGEQVDRRARLGRRAATDEEPADEVDALALHDLAEAAGGASIELYGLGLLPPRGQLA